LIQIKSDEDRITAECSLLDNLTGWRMRSFDLIHFSRV
jgi:hypothetical protein